jgi:hypothetical protein
VTPGQATHWFQSGGNGRRPNAFYHNSRMLRTSLVLPTFPSIIRHAGAGDGVDGPAWEGGRR